MEGSFTKILLAWFLFLPSVYGIYEKEIQDTMTLYKDSAMQETLDSLVGLEKRAKKEKKAEASFFALLSYWKGLTYKKLQLFKQAEESLTEAVRLGHKAEDLYYELGQVLYTAEKMPKARKAFAKSALIPFKQAVSLYYVASISQELGEWELAISFYRKILEIPDEEKKEVLQAVHFQLAEIYYEKAKKHPQTNLYLKKRVLPQYQKAIDVDPDSSLGKETMDKMHKIEEDHELILTKMINGKKVPRKKYFARILQDFKSDDNVVFAPDDQAGSATDNSSVVSSTTALARYSFFPTNWLSTAPELRFNVNHHFNRDSSGVRQNDGYGITFADRNSVEYSALGREAAVLFDAEYAIAGRNLLAEEDSWSYTFNSHSTSFMLGNKLKLTDKGDTIVRLRRRDVSSYVATSDSFTNTLALEQILNFNGGYTGMVFMNHDRLRLPNANGGDTNTTSFTFLFITPRVFDLFTPTIGLNLGFTNAFNNEEVRGEWETNFNPSIKLTRTFFEVFRTNFRYEYTKYNSRADDVYAYTKNVYGIDVEYVF